jgi:hypothetical protein
VKSPTYIHLNNLPGIQAGSPDVAQARQYHSNNGIPARRMARMAVIMELPGVGVASFGILHVLDRTLIFNMSCWRSSVDGRAVAWT